MIQKGTYKLLKEFFPMNNISDNTWKRRKEDFKIWLSEFCDYELTGVRPIMITIKEVYGDYEPLPRKVNVTNMEQKKKDYEEFTIKALGNNFKPNSQSKVARDAIDSFGLEKYHHTSQRAVAQRFVGPAFKEYGESDNQHIWVWYQTYEPLSIEDIKLWRDIMKNHKIAEEEAANAFYKASQGEDITKEKQYYKDALNELKSIKKDIPVLVSQWKCKE